MSARRDIYKRKLEQGKIEPFKGQKLIDGLGIVIGGVKYNRTENGNVVKVPDPRGLVWTGRSFQTRPIRNGVVVA